MKKRGGIEPSSGMRRAHAALCAQALSAPNPRVQRRSNAWLHRQLNRLLSRVLRAEEEADFAAAEKVVRAKREEAFG